MHFLSIIIIALLGAMSPGPDFIVVAKNALAHSRKAGILTALGIATGIICHSTYCLLGIGMMIAHSPAAYTTIKYIGALYLIYIGLKSIMTKSALTKINTSHVSLISNWQAFREGFLTNLLNPKFMLFILSLFTLVIGQSNSLSTQILYALEIMLTSIIWFTTLSYLLTHARVYHRFQKAQNIISKVLGVFLIAFGCHLAFF